MNAFASKNALAAGVAAVVAVSALLGTAAAGQTGTVMPGVFVGGIRVAGLSGARLVDALGVAARSLEQRQLQVVAGEKTWQLSPAELGIRIDLSKTASGALGGGRQTPFQWVFRTMTRAPLEVPWSLSVDRRRLTELLELIADEAWVEASNGEVAITGTKITLTPPTQGVALLKTKAEQALRNAILDPPFDGRVLLPMRISKPEIGVDQVNRVQDQATHVLAAPVQFSLEGKDLLLTQEAVASALRVRLLRDPEAPKTDAELSLRVDPEALLSQILAQAPWVHRGATDAEFDIEGDKVRVIPGTEGRTVDARAAAEAVLRLRAGSRETIPLTTYTTSPAFTTQAATDLKILQKISSFTTNFDPANAPRVTNIDLMTKAITKALIKPGEDFSLNSATGPRTPERGYQEAQIIVNGELVPGIGGGVCQVGTTVFNAVFLAGLPILERSNHSLYISKYPIGRDATVNYGYQDLRFKNDSPYGLLLEAKVTAKALTVSIYSSPLGRTVDYSASEKRNFRQPETRFIDDPTLPMGQEVIVENGNAGFDITVTRTVKEGENVLLSGTFVSKYRPWKRIVRRGTGPSPAPSPTPST